MKKMMILALAALMLLACAACKSEEASATTQAPVETSSEIVYEDDYVYEGADGEMPSLPQGVVLPEVEIDV